MTERKPKKAAAKKEPKLAPGIPLDGFEGPSKGFPTPADPQNPPKET